jgi:hypothetical protein
VQVAPGCCAVSAVQQAAAAGRTVEHKEKQKQTRPVQFIEHDVITIYDIFIRFREIHKST